MFGIVKAKAAAKGFAENSLNRGLLFKEMPEEGADDAETLSSIASLVASEGVDGTDSNTAEIEILNHLESEYPDFANT